MTKTRYGNDDEIMMMMRITMMTMMKPDDENNDYNETPKSGKTTRGSIMEEDHAK